MSARAPDAGRLALLAVAAGVAIALLGWLLIGMQTLPITMLAGGALVLVTQLAHPIEIGADGLMYAGPVGSFISHAEIQAIDESEEGAILSCSNGRRVRLVGPGRAPLPAATMNQLRGLILRHWEEPRSPVELPPRGALQMDRWLEELGRWNAARLDRGALLAAAIEPALPALVRAAAAYLVRSSLSSEERARIAFSARVTAATRLRTLLELVAGGAPEPLVVSAFEALSAPKSAPARENRRSISDDLARARADFSTQLDQLLSHDWGRPSARSLQPRLPCAPPGY